MSMGLMFLLLAVAVVDSQGSLMVVYIANAWGY